MLPKGTRPVARGVLVGCSAALATSTTLFAAELVLGVVAPPLERLQRPGLRGLRLRSWDVPAGVLVVVVAVSSGTACVLGLSSSRCAGRASRWAAGSAVASVLTTVVTAGPSRLAPSTLVLAAALAEAGWVLDAPRG